MEETKNWIKERLMYIKTGGDLSDKDNKKAYDSLKIALECVEKVEKESKQK